MRDVLGSIIDMANITRMYSCIIEGRVRKYYRYMPSTWTAVPDNN